MLAVSREIIRALLCTATRRTVKGNAVKKSAAAACPFFNREPYALSCFYFTFPEGVRTGVAICCYGYVSCKLELVDFCDGRVMGPMGQYMRFRELLS